MTSLEEKNINTSLLLTVHLKTGLVRGVVFDGSGLVRGGIPYLQKASFKPLMVGIAL